MKKIRLILIEDNRLLREGINAMLKKELDVSVVATFEDTDFDIEKLNELKPNIILLDLGLANRDSFELVKLIRDEYKDIEVIVMDLVPVQEDLIRYVEAGVAGFILKEATVPEFINTIRSVAVGEKVLPSVMTGSLFSQIIDYGIKELGTKNVLQSVRMTTRESEIIQLIAQGLSNKEIASELNLSIFTVKSHVHNILEKLALNTRVQIAIHAHTIE